MVHAKGARIRVRGLQPAQVLAGLAGRGAEVHEVGDRREAIRLAVGLAAAGDCVVVAGKGHETGQEIDGTVHPFDDRQVLRDVLAGTTAQVAADAGTRA